MQHPDDRSLSPVQSKVARTSLIACMYALAYYKPHQNCRYGKQFFVLRGKIDYRNRVDLNLVQLLSSQQDLRDCVAGLSSIRRRVAVILSKPIRSRSPQAASLSLLIYLLNSSCFFYPSRKNPSDQFNSIITIQLTIFCNNLKL